MSEQAVRPAARTPRWRWAVPAVVVAAIAAAIGIRPMVADASPSLPPRTAAELLASLPDAAKHPFSGTVSETARLGLPDLPTSVQGQHAPLSATSLLTGTHTMRVWYAGPDQQRVALVGDLAEADVIHNGQDVWAWNSDTRSGVHLRLPGTAGHGTSGNATPTPPPLTPLQLMQGLTPQQLAQQLLAKIDPTTKVSVDGTATVAGRDAYELVVAPRDQRSLVRQIRLAVDARTSLPLRLEVFSTGSSDPAIESGFTSIGYQTPSAGVFRAPSGPMKELTVPQHGASPLPSTSPLPGTAPSTSTKPSLGISPSDVPRVHGSGWTTVLELSRLPDLSAATGGLSTTRPQGKGDTDGGGSQPAPTETSIQPGGPMSGPSTGTSQGALLQSLLSSAQSVSGPFGTGRLLRTALVSVLVLDNGHVFVGAVTPATLEQVAAGSAHS